jgi:hypothetical protein
MACEGLPFDIFPTKVGCKIGNLSYYAAMEIITDTDLLDRIDAFLAAQDMAPSRFGLEAMGDGALVSQLRSGRSLTLKNAARVIAFMSQYPTQSGRAA